MTDLIIKSIVPSQKDVNGCFRGLVIIGLIILAIGIGIGWLLFKYIF